MLRIRRRHGVRAEGARAREEPTKTGESVVGGAGTRTRAVAAKTRRAERRSETRAGGEKGAETNGGETGKESQHRGGGAGVAIGRRTRGDERESGKRGVTTRRRSVDRWLNSPPRSMSDYVYELF